MLLSVTRDGLLCLPNDLELQARVASLFTAWATYTDGRLVGPDLRVTGDYMGVLKTFRERCVATGKDSEHVNRMRLIGIAAMTSAVSSDAFYVSPVEFSRQVAIVVPALLASPHEAGLESVVVESTLVSADPSPNSPYLSEFQPRPILDRRAASIHAHVDGQKGPEISDVVNASLRALRNLLGRCTGAQVAIVFDSILQSLDHHQLWEDSLVRNSYVERVIEWTQYQFRYAVPSHLVDQLLAIQDAPFPTPKHSAFVEMLTTVFNSPHPLINLSTSDVISSLMTILLRRVSINSNDSLLQSLVECISSLGTHVYYADQIHDLAEEVVARLVNVQVNGVLGRGKGGSERARESALKCLLGCLSGLTEAADRHAAKYKAKLAEDSEAPTPDEENGDRPPSESTTTTVRAARRNKVSPESWQETLALMCEADYGIRAMYARGLTSFVQREVKREPFVRREDDSSETPEQCKVKVIVDPDFKVSSRPSIVHSDSISRFLNALHATIFTLATSNGSGNQASAIAAQLKQQDSVEAPSTANINVIPPSDTHLPTVEISPPPVVIDFVIRPPSTPASPTGNSDHPPPTATSVASTISSVPGNGEFSPPDSNRRRSRHQNGSRKLSVALNLLDGNHVGLVATPSDFAHLRYILLSAHQQVPCRAVLTGVPMLLALEQATRKPSNDLNSGAVRAIREVICHTWIAIGHIWEAPAIVESATKALDSLEITTLPEVQTIPPTQLNPQEEPNGFAAELPAFSSETCGIIDAEIVLPALASSSGLQAVTGLDRQGLFKRFTIGWSVDGALKDSVEHASNQDILRGETPFLKLSPAFMQKDNQSLASLARSTHGGVGVGDLREALGRGSVSNPALATASLSSTVERASSMARRGDRGSRPEPLAISRIKSKGRAQQNEVRDVLNKLGIGKQSTGGMKMLRSPFPPASQQKSPDPSIDGSNARDVSLTEPPY
ncbi:plasma membrane localization protein [Serendipita sp. 396]|nr:plasma membrane localization protein [Serendipita sp. 396]